MYTLLLADDNKLNRVCYQRILERHGYHLITATNGQEAFTLAKSHQPDLILMDMNMPMMNGYQAIQALKNDPNTCAIPIIALIFSYVDKKENVLQAGAQAWIEAKPLDFDDLFTQIEALLQGKRISDKE